MALLCTPSTVAVGEDEESSREEQSDDFLLLNDPPIGVGCLGDNAKQDVASEQSVVEVPVRITLMEVEVPDVLPSVFSWPPQSARTTLQALPPPPSNREYSPTQSADRHLPEAHWRNPSILSPAVTATGTTVCAAIVVRSLWAAERSCCVTRCWASRCRSRVGLCWPVWGSVVVAVVIGCAESPCSWLDGRPGRQDC